MKKVYFLIVLVLTYSLLCSKNYYSLENSLLYFSYSGNDNMKNGLYESLKFSHNNLKSYSEYFQGFQKTYSEDYEYEQYEFKRSYARSVKTNLKIGFDLKYTRVVNGIFEQAFLGGINGYFYTGNFSFTFSPAINYSFDGVEDIIYQCSGNMSYKYKDLFFNASTYLYTVKDNDFFEENLNYLQEGSITYYGDYIGIYTKYSFGEKYLLTTFDNTYLNLSVDEFLHGLNIGILHYPILRNWSINYEFRKNLYRNLNGKYSINTHLLDFFISW